MRRLIALLAVAAGLSAPVDAQNLAVQWSAASRWVQAVPGARENLYSDAGASRSRLSTLECRSTLSPDQDLPIVVRFDSTETTLVGRATNVVNAVAAFPGSAWDVSDPDAPRRLNMLLREPPSAVPDTAWTPAAREPLFVMASPYDGTGTTYLGHNLITQATDCLYKLSLEASDGHAPGPVTMHVQPTSIYPPFARREGTRAEVSWRYFEPQGAAFQIRRVREGAGAGPVIGSAPLASHFFLDADSLAEGEHTYRVEVVDAQGRLVHTSPHSAVPTPSSSQNLTVLGRYATPRPRASDVWGYVGPDGREYALLNSLGLTVVDVTDPAQPVEVAHIPGGASDIEAFGHHVYVTHDSGPVQVIDLTDPTAPVLVHEFPDTPSSPTAGVHTVSIADGRMYLNGNGGMSIWSLADPSHPAFLGRYGGDYVHDVLVRGDTVYAALINGGRGVDIVDVSDPTQPTRIANFTYPGAGAHNICSTASGRYLFVGDEIGTAGRWTRVFDVSDVHNVELVAQIVADPTATVHNCHIVGDRLFLAHYNRGVRVWDVSDPMAPTEIAHHDFEGVGQAGIWTVWPHLPSGRLLASDLQHGLLVLELDGSVAAEPTPSETAAFSLAPNPTASGAHALVTLTAPATVALDVYSVLGRRVAHHAWDVLGAGPHRLGVPAAALPAGVYVVRLSVDGRPAGAQRLTVAR